MVVSPFQGGCLANPFDNTSHDRRGSGNLMFPFVIRLHRWFFCLLGRGSFHFFLCISPFLDALIYL